MLNFLSDEESCSTEEEINEGQDHSSANHQLSSWLGIFKSLAKLAQTSFIQTLAAALLSSQLHVVMA